MLKLLINLTFFIVYLCSCTNNNVKDIVSTECKNSFDASKLNNYIKNNFNNPSDSAQFCLSGLSNFDTLNYCYSKRNYNSIWFNNSVNFLTIDSIIIYLKNSNLHGLQPRWYNYDLISNKIIELKSVKYKCDSTYILLSEIEILLSDAVLKYSKHICYGFFNPLVEYDKCYFLPLKENDSALFEKVLNPATILNFLYSIQPKSKEYKLLQIEYLKLLNLKWDTIPNPDTPKIYLGDSNLILKQIAKRLIVTNELDSTYKNNSFDIYDTLLQKAIVIYQKKYGLLADGVIGQNTINQMNISAKDRAQQIAVNLERLRWNNYKYNNMHININLPEFMLYAYNYDTLKVALKICCGEKKPSNYNERLKKYLKTHKIQDRPPNHETPIFEAKISHIVLNPDWLVPLNIIQKELYYNFLKDIMYLSDHEYKVYLKDKEVNPDSINWKKYDPNHIPFRIKQNPGEINALGKIKFVFYNPFDVFLHDTPSKNNFNRAYRAVSHGCMRVEEPLKLAKLFLKDDKKWELDEVRMAIGMVPDDKKDKIKYKKRLEKFKDWKKLAEKDSVKLEIQKIFLKKTIPITINYFTAFADTNGIIEYREDLYKRDNLIKLQLNKLDK